MYTGVSSLSLVGAGTDLKAEIGFLTCELLTVSFRGLSLLRSLTIDGTILVGRATNLSSAFKILWDRGRLGIDLMGAGTGMLGTGCSDNGVASLYMASP